MKKLLKWAKPFILILLIICFLTIIVPVTYSYVPQFIKYVFDNILEATTAEETRKIFANNCPDLTILDIMLPDNFDLKLLYELLAINKEARIVVNSAINKPEITREALLAGARGFITKPFNEVDFLCKVKMALED